MKVHELVDSKIFFEISKHVLLHEGKRDFVKTFLKLIVSLPFALSYKIWITFLKSGAVFVSGLFLGATLGVSKGLRELFIHRVSALAKNLADWVLYPFAIATCFSRFFLAMLIHPALFFRY